jgi:hypothetical protein
MLYSNGENREKIRKKREKAQKHKKTAEITDNAAHAHFSLKPSEVSYATLSTSHIPISKKNPTKIHKKPILQKKKIIKKSQIKTPPNPFLVLAALNPAASYECSVRRHSPFGREDFRALLTICRY